MPGRKWRPTAISCGLQYFACKCAYYDLVRYQTRISFRVRRCRRLSGPPGRMDMNEVLFSESPPIMVLPALTAADLMTPNPVSLADVATVKEAIAFLIDRGIGGAPVIDEAGRPVGVLTQHDIVVHDRETVSYFTPDRDYMDAGTPLGRHLGDDFLLENVDRTQIRDLMTPVIFSVRLDTPAAKVIEE